MMGQPLRIDNLIADAAAGRISRRDIVRYGTALGLGTSTFATLIGACDRLLDAAHSQGHC